MKVIRWLVSTLSALAMLVALSPGIAYLIAIAQVDGRPVPADPSSYTQEAIEAAWQQCHERLPMALDARNAWQYVVSFYDYDMHKRPRGERAAGRIALHHNGSNADLRSNLWWHFSGAALSIWIARNWSAEQIGATLVRDNLCQPRSRG